MLDSALGASPRIRRLQSIAARAANQAGLSADGATIAGASLGVLAGLCFAAGASLAGVAMLAASAALDAIDGTIAREFAAPRALGGILDLSADRVVEVAVIIGIAWNRPQLHFAAFVLVCTWYVNITIFLAVGAALERRGPKLIEYPPGILERTEALIFLVVLLALRRFGPILCYAFAVLEVVTGAQRLLFGMRMLRSR